jgi:hypothetical protein
MPKENKDYLQYAENAADLERNGFFADAAFEWTCASMKATHACNRAWCEARTHRCSKLMPHKPRKAEAA